MNRLFSFFLGIVAGGVLMYGGLKYHVVRASDGFHLIPKVTAELAGTYVDVRGFNLTDWNEHRWLAMALVQSKNEHILHETAGEQFQQSISGMFHALGGKSPGTAEF